MSNYLHLRQVCLVATDIDRVIADIEGIFGVKLCHQDHNVGKHGLVNAMFPFGYSFLEVVVPTRDGTAAGRFLERSGGTGGYMAIFSCHDPERRRDNAKSLGIKVAYEMDYGTFKGCQLHPRDCRAAIIEFDCTTDGEALDGAYWPAGDHWQDCIRTEVTRGITQIDVESPDAADIAAHWSKIIELPVTADMKIESDLTRVAFIKGSANSRETLRALHIDVVNPDVVAEAAKSRGYDVTNRSFEMFGVRFHF